MGLISKNEKQNCTCSTLFCTYLCSCFALLQLETSRNFLVTRFMEEMLYVFLFTFVFTVAIEFSCFSSNEIGLRCFFISRSSYFSVSHVNLDIKCSRKEDSMLLLLLFLSLSL